MAMDSDAMALSAWTRLSSLARLALALGQILAEDHQTGGEDADAVGSRPAAAIRPLTSA